MGRFRRATDSAGHLDYGRGSGPLRRCRNQTARCRYDPIPVFFAAPLRLESAPAIALANGFLALAYPVSLSDPPLSPENDRGACSRRATLRAQKPGGSGSVSPRCTFQLRRGIIASNESAPAARRAAMAEGRSNSLVVGGPLVTPFAGPGRDRSKPPVERESVQPWMRTQATPKPKSEGLPHRSL